MDNFSMFYNFQAPLLRADSAFEKDVMPFMVFKTIGPETQYLHSHDYIQMWYMLGGSCQHHFNGRDFIMQKGDLFILPPNTSHYITCDSNPENELITCEFSESFINENVGGSDKNTLF